MEFNKGIFRSYDIRGVYGKDFDEGFAEDLGKAVAAFFNASDEGKTAGKTFVVGRDIRLSSESLGKALIGGLTEAGLDVVDVGVVTTPLLYFSVVHLKKDGGIMITASHNPAEFNGFKIVGSVGDPISEGLGLEKIRDIMLKGEYAASPRKGTVESYTKIFDDYAAFVLPRIKLKRKMKVVLDTCNSVPGLIAPSVLERAGCEVVTINKELDGTFKSRPPEPRAENLKALQDAVRANGADLGIAYDGDGDRVVFVDETGKIIDSGSSIIMIFAEHYLNRNRNSKIVFDLGCSIAVEDTIKRLGGIPVVTPVGTANLKKGMMEERAIFGGESSNHMYFSETFYFDDAVFASLKMAEILSEIGSLSKKLNSLPNYPYLSEWDFECPDEKKFGVVGSLKEKFKKSGVRVSELDGVKLMWDDGWVLWRASNTRPQVKVYLEATSDERFEELKNFAKAELLEAMGG